MIDKPIRNAYMDAPALLAKARRAAWSIRDCKKHPGFKLLGSGHFSAVYAFRDSPSLVLKVGGFGGYGDKFVYGCEPDSYMGRDAWPVYVEHTSGLTPLPEWAPRVYHVEAMCPETYFAVMERLSERPSEKSYYHKYEEVGLDCGDALYGVFGDCHSGNIMMRGDVEVITDPWVYG